MPAKKNSDSKKSFILKDKAAIYIVVLTSLIFLIMTGVIAITSYSMFEQAFYNYSNQLCLSSNAQAAFVIDGDLVEYYAKTLTVDKEYEQFAAKLDELTKRIDAKYFYVLADNGVEGMYTYIYDATHSQEFPKEKYALGRNETVKEYEGADKVLRTGKGFDKALYYNERYGELYYAYAPIFNSHDEVVAFVGTDVDIAPLREGLSDYRQTIILTVLITFAFFVALYVLIVRHVHTQPISSLTHSLNLLKTILNGMDGFLYVSDINTDEILFINDKMKEHFNLDELNGQTCWQVLQSGFTQRCDFCPIKTLLENPDDFVSWEEHNTVTKRYYKNIDRIIEWTDGRKVHLQHSTDITDLIEARKLAEHASKAKTEFLSRMSHEMRTPMNAIIGMTNIAISADDKYKKDHCLNKIDNASKHLLNIINDILDMSKIEANKLELYSQEFDFEKMLIDLINVTNSLTEEKKQNLIVNLNKNVPSSFFGDEFRLTQVISNLLTNAIKFTPQYGTVTLNVDKTAQHDNIATLQIEVIDNGIGIPSEQQAFLFESFEQADGSISRKFGGTGLGLAISKQIVELMGGRIWIESELDVGSKFTFAVNMEIGKSAPGHKLSSDIDKDNIHILAVDDSSEIRDYFVNVMDMLGVSCDVAADGFEALEMIEKKQYNIFFIDWQMPELNGIELTKKIKELSKEKAVVIMISIAEWSTIENDAVNAGVDRFISKPIFPSALINCINECMGDPHDIAESDNITAAQDVYNFENHSLLLAEDVEINKEIVLSMLDSSGLTIDCVENGVEAVSMVIENPGKYSLILMDIQMPEMNGYEAAREIRKLQYEDAKNIPIIAMTANVFKEDIDRCLAAGMNDHIGKPIDANVLIKKISQYLAVKKEKEIMKTSTDYAAFLPNIDVVDGLNRLMNNKELYFKLLNNFSGRQMADELLNNINDEDYLKTAQTAHALKGVAANLGLVKLMKTVSDIEVQAKAELDSKNLAAVLNEVTDETISAIKKLLEGE